MTRARAFAVLAVVLAAAAGLGWFLVARRVVEHRVVDVTLEDGRHFEAIVFVGPRGTPPGELRLVGTDGAIVWHRLEERPYGMGSEYRGHVLFRHGARLAWVEVATGRAVWDVPDEVDEVTHFFVDDDVVDAYEVPYTPRQRFRRRSLADGTVRWDVEPPSLGEDQRWTLRHARGRVFLDSSETILRLHLEDGALERLVPEDSEAVCTDAEGDVAYRDSGSRLWFRRAGGEPREIGAVAPGRLVCARVGGRPWIVWDAGLSGRPAPLAPDVAVLEDGRAPASASGALWSLHEDGSPAWAIASGWGVPELGLPRDAVTICLPPREPLRGIGTGRLTLQLVEDPEFEGEESGCRGGGAIEAVLDEASGRLL